MATITTGVILLRWPLVSATLMFLASTLNIRFRKTDYRFLSIIFSVIGIAAAFWFAAGLLGLDISLTALLNSALDRLTKTMNQPLPEWPVVMT